MSAPASRGRLVTAQFDVPSRMRDGTVLRANVYRPDGGGPWPVLLTRTPYGKDDPLCSATLDPMEVARRGFLVVVQDVRGRFASDGEWVPLRHEREDGHDTVEWAARLPGSNGRVGMYGGSYTGSTQWMAAVERPPSLHAIAPLLTWCEPLDGLLARGGALELGLAIPWGLHSAGGDLARRGLPEDERARRFEHLLDDIDRLAHDGYRALPVREMPPMSRHDAPDLGTLRVLDDPGAAAWSRVAGAHERVAVAAINVGGWHDLFVQGTLDNHVAMTELGRTSRLIVGPWAHGDTRLSDPTGALSFGLRSCGVGIPAHAHGDVNDEQLAFLGRHLGAAPTDPSAGEGPPVRIFTMGRNAWRDEPAWPLARACEQRWFLQAGGKLSPHAPSAGAPSEYVYDPSDPVPTVGGQTANIAGCPPGPFHQAPVEERRDVLVFTSEPLQQELEVTGRVTVVLHAASSAPSTDWVARLCDVHPDGRSYNLCDGIVRIAEDADRLQRVELDLWSTSNAFLPGHRLRVHVTSSNFPRWDRNLNTGDQRATRMRVAHQQIHHDPDRASWIELPVA